MLKTQSENRIEKLVFWDIENIPSKYGSNFVEYIAGENTKVMAVFSSIFKDTNLQEYVNLNKIAYQTVEASKDAADDLIKKQFQNFLDLYMASTLKFKELVLVTNDKVLIKYFKNRVSQMGVVLKLFYTQKLGGRVIKKSKFFNPVKMKTINRKNKKIKNLDHINMEVPSPPKETKKSDFSHSLKSVYGGEIAEKRKNDIVGMFKNLKDVVDVSYLQKLEGKKAEEHYTKLSILNHLKRLGAETAEVSPSKSVPEIKLDDDTYLDCVAIDLTGRTTKHEIKNKILGNIGARLQRIYKYRDSKVLGEMSDYVLVVNYIDPDQVYSRQELIEDVKKYLMSKNAKNKTRLERLSVLSGIVVMNESMFEEPTAHRDFIYNQYKKGLKPMSAFSKGFSQRVF